MYRDAKFSDCSKYRYRLSRVWDKSKSKVLFIMLNPSEADAKKDDPTIKKCISFSKKWGYGGLMVGNLFAYITPYPKELFSVNNPVGKDNESNIEIMAKQCKKIVCAWGNNQGAPPDYFKKFSEIYYLKLLNDGITPGHPLYLNSSLTPQKYSF